jgi:hypothetical protein
VSTRYKFESEGVWLNPTYRILAQFNVINHFQSFPIFNYLRAPVLVLRNLKVIEYYAFPALEKRWFKRGERSGEMEN